jgi:hypothetical protein
MSQDLRGRETVPVISLEGAMGVLLYGMAAVVEVVDGMSEERGWLLAKMSVLKSWIKRVREN